MATAEEQINKPYRKWPSLERIIRESRRLKRELDREHLLEPTEELHLDSDSDVSEITDVFEEFHKESFLKKQPETEKYLTKLEADNKVMDLFTPEFKNTMEALRAEMKIGDEMYQESLEQIKDYLNTPEPTDQSKSVNTDLLESLDIKATNIQELQAKLSENSIISVESGVWNLLEAKSDPTKFQISPPGYNAFRGKKHWSERPTVSQHKIDESKLKCEKWFETI